MARVVIAWISCLKFVLVSISILMESLFTKYMLLVDDL